MYPKPADGMTNDVSPGSGVIKMFSCSNELSMKFFLLINVEMSTILTFMSMKNSILGLSEPGKCLTS